MLQAGKGGKGGKGPPTKGAKGGKGGKSDSPKSILKNGDNSEENSRKNSGEIKEEEEGKKESTGETFGAENHDEYASKNRSLKLRTAVYVKDLKFSITKTSFLELHKAKTLHDYLLNLNKGSI